RQRSDTDQIFVRAVREDSKMNPVSMNGGAEENPNLPVEASLNPHNENVRGAEYSAHPAQDHGPGNIDKIRDILFGANMRDYEQRSARLEEALKKESSDLRESTRHHLENLEAFVHKEFAAIDARLNAERAERSESHSRLANELSSTSAAVY